MHRADKRANHIMDVRGSSSHLPTQQKRDQNQAEEVKLLHFHNCTHVLAKICGFLLERTKRVCEILTGQASTA